MTTPTPAERMKSLLWRWYGSGLIPAEWDGHTLGGGKISQRFWEYFIAIEMLDLPEDALVLDIGGGSPAVGLSMFPRVLAASGARVVVLDVNFGSLADGEVENVTLERGLADRETLASAFERYRPTHLSCVSVLEHASEEQQKGIFDAVEAAFDGDTAVFTLEFHETRRFFDRQPTTAGLSTAVSGLTRYYLDRIERSPLNCVNAFDDTTRLWYPLALRFRRSPGDPV